MARNSVGYLLLLIMLLQINYLASSWKQTNVPGVLPDGWDHLVKGADELLSVCGQPVLSSRIVGGQPSKIGAWPWQVSIRQNGAHFCGGSLVAAQWVLSAAHCFKQNPLVNITVTLGDYQLDNPSPNAWTIQVAQVICNVAYEGTGTRSDIALLRLQRPVTYSPYMLPVCLPSHSTEFPDGMSCQVTGWGSIRFGVPLPSPMTLQEVKVTLISVKRCNQMFSVPQPDSNGFEPILDTMICAGYEAGGKDACQGDSGGPLVCIQSDSWFLVGVVSWGEKCALPYRPGVYTKVGAYADWLKRYIPGLQFGVMPITLQGQEKNAVGIPAASPLGNYSISLLLPVLQLVFTRGGIP